MPDSNIRGKKGLLENTWQSKDSLKDTFVGVLVTKMNREEKNEQNENLSNTYYTDLWTCKAATALQSSTRALVYSSQTKVWLSKYVKTFGGITLLYIASPNNRVEHNAHPSCTTREN